MPYTVVNVSFILVVDNLNTRVVVSTRGVPSLWDLSVPILD